MDAPKVGESYQFVPAALCFEYDNLCRAYRKKPKPVIGRVIAVNEDRRHFTVAYNLGSYTLRETIKF